MYQCVSECINMFEHVSTSINIYQHVSTCINMHQHVSTCINMYQHGSTWINMHRHLSTCINIYQHSSTCITMHQHASAYINMYQHVSTCCIIFNMYQYVSTCTNMYQHVPTFTNICQHVSTFVNICQRLSTIFFLLIHVIRYSTRLLTHRVPYTRSDLWDFPWQKTHGFVNGVPYHPRVYQQWQWSFRGFLNWGSPKLLVSTLKSSKDLDYFWATHVRETLQALVSKLPVSLSCIGVPTKTSCSFWHTVIVSKAHRDDGPFSQRHWPERHFCDGESFPEEVSWFGNQFGDEWW